MGTQLNRPSEGAAVESEHAKRPSQGAANVARGPPSISEASSRQPPVLKKAKHEELRFETESSDIPASEPARERYYEQQTKIRAIRKAARRQKGVEAEAGKQTEGNMDMRAVQQGLGLSDTDDEEPGTEGEYLVLSVTIGRRFTTTFGNELRIPVHQKLEIVNGHFKSFKMNTGIISPLIAMVHSTSDLGRFAEASLYEKANKLREDMDQFALKHSSEALDAVSCLGSADGNILSGSELQKQLVKALNDDETDQKTRIFPDEGFTIASCMLASGMVLFDLNDLSGAPEIHPHRVLFHTIWLVTE